MTYREYLLTLAQKLNITDEEAGEPQWAAYLTDAQLADAICSIDFLRQFFAPSTGEQS